MAKNKILELKSSRLVEYGSVVVNSSVNITNKIVHDGIKHGSKLYKNKRYIIFNKASDYCFFLRILSQLLINT